MVKDVQVLSLLGSVIDAGTAVSSLFVSLNYLSLKNGDCKLVFFQSQDGLNDRGPPLKSPVYRNLVLVLTHGAIEYYSFSKRAIGTCCRHFTVGPCCCFGADKPAASGFNAGFNIFL